VPAAAAAPSDEVDRAVAQRRATMKHPRRHIRPFASLSLAGSLVLLGLASSPSASLLNNIDKQTPPSLTAQPRIVESYGKLPLSFEANVGQTSSQVDFLSRGQGYTLFLTRRAEAVLVLGKSAPERTPAQPTDKLSAVVKPQPEVTPPAVVRIKLVGAKLTPQVEGLEEFPGKANYFIGNDPKKWRTNVPMYAKVRAHAVYPGVDLVYYGNQRQLEHDFIVAPGADPGAITMAVEGAERLSLGAQGDLVLQMKNEQVRFQKPVAYQEVEGVRREIPSSYRLKNAHRVGFQVAAYDGSRPLIIDPVLAYSTYLGGSGGDGGNAIALDASGNAYVTGFTISTDFPTTTGAYQTTLKGNGNAFVTKLNPSLPGLASLVYSTYLGGSNNDFGLGIAVDAAGNNAYVTGGTTSSDFPTTLGAYQTTLKDTNNAFVTKLNPSLPGLASLVYSTYLGGSTGTGNGGNAITVDAAAAGTGP